MCGMACILKDMMLGRVIVDGRVFRGRNRAHVVLFPIPNLFRIYSESYSESYSETFSETPKT